MVMIPSVPINFLCKKQAIATYNGFEFSTQNERPVEFGCKEALIVKSYFTVTEIEIAMTDGWIFLHITPAGELISVKIQRNICRFNSGEGLTPEKYS
jgi:hypothetical protein